MRRAQAGDRARDGRCERAAFGAHAFGVGKAVVFVGLRGIDFEHPRVGGGGRAGVVIDGGKLLLLAEPDRQASISAEAAGGGLDHETREGRRSDGVDRVAAGT